MADLPAGVALAACAAACFEGAYVLQALEARHGEDASLGRLVRRPRWLAGIALAVAGAALQIGALRLAPITVVQPTLALGVVVLVLAGSRIFDERLTPADFAAAAAIAGGVALLAIAGDDVTHDRIRTVPAALTLAVLAAPLLTVLALRAWPPGRGGQGRRSKAAKHGEPGARVERAPAGQLVLAAGAGDAIAGLAAARFAAELSPLHAVVLVWFAVGSAALIASLSAEMSAVRTWPVTRVGPLVLGCQTALPVLLAPIVVGQDWTGRAPVVLAGLALTLAGAARLAGSAGALREAGA